MEINPHFREGRKKPWEARWWVNRKPRSRFFATEKERDKFIRDFKKEIAQHGTEVFQFDKGVARRWQIVAEILPDVDPVDMAEYWLANHLTSEKRTFAEAIQSYLLEMQRAGRDEEYKKHTLRALERFSANHGDKALQDITSQDISEFIHDLPFQAMTKSHYRTYLVGAFKWFISQKWTNSNPASAVPNPKVHLAEPGILTVAETEALFRKNEKVDPDICGLLALGAFAGMRSSAISRLSWDELDFKNRAILTPAAKTKKGRRQFIEGLPDTRRSRDLFAQFRYDNFRIPADWQLKRATFKVRFDDNPTARSVTVKAPNVARYTRDSDATVVEEWLTRRGFIQMGQVDGSNQNEFRFSMS